MIWAYLGFLVLFPMSSLVWIKPYTQKKIKFTPKNHLLTLLPIHLHDWKSDTVCFKKKKREIDQSGHFRFCFTLAHDQLKMTECGIEKFKASLAWSSEFQAARSSNFSVLQKCYCHRKLNLYVCNSDSVP